MSWLVSFISLSLGLAAVLQGGINRLISSKWGLTPVILLNNGVIFIAAIILYIVVKAKPALFPDFFRERSLYDFSWWYILPGLFGLTLVAGIPFAISKIGALRVFVGIVAGQMIVGLIWDLLVEGIPINLTRIIGACLTLLGVAILTLKG